MQPPPQLPMLMLRCRTWLGETASRSDVEVTKSGFDGFDKVCIYECKNCFDMQLEVIFKLFTSRNGSACKRNAGNNQRELVLPKGTSECNSMHGVIIIAKQQQVSSFRKLCHFAYLKFALNATLNIVLATCFLANPWNKLC